MRCWIRLVKVHERLRKYSVAHTNICLIKIEFVPVIKCTQNN